MNGDAFPGGVAVAGKIFFDGRPINGKVRDGVVARIPAHDQAVAFFAEVNATLVIFRHDLAIVATVLLNMKGGQLRRCETIGDLFEIDA